MKRVVSIGECMVELSRGADMRFGLAYGGDTFNTAVYLARAGTPVAYATALGDDLYSNGILELAKAEGIGTDLVHIARGRMPGLYLIETNASGERTFFYWRDRAPARDLLDGPGGAAVISAVQDAAAIYLSGITLSLYSDAALARLEEAIRAAKALGVRVVMDSNYRPRGWAGDTAEGKTWAQATFRRFWSLADVALPTFDDEQALWDDASVDATAARLTSLGIGEIAIKNGPAGAHVFTAGQQSFVACPENITPVDTSAAGDSFNAAYLAARLRGATCEAAALAGHRLAGIVIQHRGADRKSVV